MFHIAAMLGFTSFKGFHQFHRVSLVPWNWKIETIVPLTTICIYELKPPLLSEVPLVPLFSLRFTSSKGFLEFHRVSLVPTIFKLKPCFHKLELVSLVALVSIFKPSFHFLLLSSFKFKSNKWFTFLLKPWFQLTWACFIRFHWFEIET